MKTKVFEFETGDELIECLVGQCYAVGDLPTDSNLIYQLRQTSFISTKPKAEFFVLTGELPEGEE